MFRKFRQTNISTAKSDALGSIHISVTGYVTLGKLFNLSLILSVHIDKMGMILIVIIITNYRTCCWEQMCSYI